MSTTPNHSDPCYAIIPVKGDKKIDFTIVVQPTLRWTCPRYRDFKTKHLPFGFRALCDTGSTLNLISRKMVTKLQLPIKTLKIAATGVGEQEIIFHEYVELEIESPFQSVIKMWHEFGPSYPRIKIKAVITESMPEINIDIMPFIIAKYTMNL